MSRRQLTFFLLRANLDVSCGLVLSSLYLLWINVNMCICYQSQIFREGRQNMTSLRLSVKHRLLQRRHLCHVSAATGLTSKTAVFGWKLGPSEVWFYLFIYLFGSIWFSFLSPKKDLISVLQQSRSWPGAKVAQEPQVAPPCPGLRRKVITADFFCCEATALTTPPPCWPPWGF